MKYCSVSDIENYTLTEVADYFEPQVEKWIEGVSRQFDRMANRTLVADPVGSGEDYPVRYFDGNGKRSLIVEDLVEVESVEVDDTEIEADPYPKLPPHWKLTASTGFPIGEQNVKVTGRFGLFDEVPEDLRFACAVVVAGIIAAYGLDADVSSEKIGNYAVTYSTEKGASDYEAAKKTVLGYRRFEF